MSRKTGRTDETEEEGCGNLRAKDGGQHQQHASLNKEAQAVCAVKGLQHSHTTQEELPAALRLVQKLRDSLKATILASLFLGVINVSHRRPAIVDGHANRKSGETKPCEAVERHSGEDRPSREPAANPKKEEVHAKDESNKRADGLPERQEDLDSVDETLVSAQPQLNLQTVSVKSSERH